MSQRGMTYDEAQIAIAIRKINLATFGIIVGETGFDRDRAIVTLLAMDMEKWLKMSHTTAGLMFGLSELGEAAYLKWAELPF